MNGKISSVTDYGVFVELEAGVEGLVHVSEISWSRRAQSPKKMFHKGQDVEVQVLGVDTVEKRISLGMKQFQENPWDSVAERYPVGSRVNGRVRNITDFGAFVELEEGIDGLVHVSDISCDRKQYGIQNKWLLRKGDHRHRQARARCTDQTTRKGDRLARPVPAYPIHRHG